MIIVDIVRFIGYNGFIERDSPTNQIITLGTTMDNQEKLANRDKIIERVRQLLAMGSDTSSPNEASIALNRARKLMDAHQISATDIENAKGSDFGENAFTTESSQNRTWVGILVVAIAKMNSCVVAVKPRWNKKERISYIFKGFEEDSKMCQFMMAYLCDAVDNFYKVDKKNYGLKGASDKNSYFVGFASGICTRIDEEIKEREGNAQANSSSTALVVAKNAVVEARFGSTPTKESRKTTKGKGNYLGNVAAKKAHLGSFMNNKAEKNEAIKAKNTDFDKRFDALWADIEEAGKASYDSNRYALTELDVDDTGKEWLKNQLLESFEILSEVNTGKEIKRMVRIYKEDSYIDFDIVISKDGINIMEGKSAEAA